MSVLTFHLEMFAIQGYKVQQYYKIFSLVYNIFLQHEIIFLIRKEVHFSRCFQTISDTSTIYQSIEILTNSQFKLIIPFQSKLIILSLAGI